MTADVAPNADPSHPMPHPPKPHIPAPDSLPDPAPPANPFSSVVSSVVDDIVDNAVTAATLHAEKRNVQTLINNLVSRVHDAATAPASSSLAKNSSASTQSRSLSTGVPVGDHRLRQCPNHPLAWTQTLDSLTLYIPVPSWVSKHHVSISFTPGSVKASVRESKIAEPALLIDEPLVAPVDVDGCMWVLEGEHPCRKLILELEKSRVQWWARLFMSDDPAEYRLVQLASTSPTEDAEAPTANGHHAESQTSANRVNKAVSTEDPHSQEAKQSGRVDDEQDSDVSLEEAVSNAVEEIVSAVAAKDSRPSSKKKETTSSRNDREEDESGTPSRQQKPLTRADLPKIVEQYKDTIKKGGRDASEAALQLATFYHHGIGLEKDDSEAARLYKYALENGMLDPSAAFQLGLIYNQGAPGLEPSPSEAVRWWRVSASLGNSVAMFNLGVMYMNGSGCDMDPIMATRWFQQAQALNPQLQPPQFTRAQLEERIATAMRLRKEKMKRALPPEEKRRRKELALQRVRNLAYGSAAIVGLSISVIAIRYWWRNRL